MGGEEETWFEIYGTRNQSVENSSSHLACKIENHLVFIKASSKQKFFAASNVFETFRNILKISQKGIFIRITVFVGHMYAVVHKICSIVYLCEVTCFVYLNISLNYMDILGKYLHF